MVPGFGDSRVDHFAGSESIRGELRKEHKVVEDGWTGKSTLATEDPFEVSIDAANVQHLAFHRKLRQELLVCTLSLIPCPLRVSSLPPRLSHPLALITLTV